MGVSKANVRIDLIPVSLLRDAWLPARDWLAKGAEVAAENELQMLRDVVLGQAQLWLISDAEEKQCVGALLTKVTRLEDGRSALHMYALAGRNLWAWAHKLHARMYDFAVGNELDAVRFFGREEWKRFFPDCSILEAQGRNGHELFERAIP